MHSFNALPTPPMQLPHEPPKKEWQKPHDPPFPYLHTKSQIHVLQDPSSLKAQNANKGVESINAPHLIAISGSFGRQVHEQDPPSKSIGFGVGVGGRTKLGSVHSFDPLR